VSNEQPTLTDVYFDDVKMTHTSKIIQYNEYYPFGMQSAESYTKANSTNNFLYDQGGELNTTSGWYDLSFRNYDPALGRFHQVDPMATSFHNLTPYNYAGNNPVMYTDPSGAALKSPPPTEYPGDYGGANGNQYTPPLIHSWADDAPLDYTPMASSQVERDAQAVQNGLMSIDEYVDKYGNGAYAYSGSTINPGASPMDRLVYRQFLASGASNYNRWLQASGYSNLVTQQALIRQRSLLAGQGHWVEDDRQMDYDGIGIVGYRSIWVPDSNASSSNGNDWIYDHNNQLGLAMATVEPGFGAGIDVVKAGGFTKATTIGVKGAGYGLVGLNVGLTSYTIVREIQNDQFDTHSIVNIAVTTIGTGLAVAGAVVTAPVWGTALAVTGAVVGVGYGIAQIAGIDSWIDSNWSLKH
jgi:RHS repeat-associated protein